MTHKILAAAAFALLSSTAVFAQAQPGAMIASGYQMTSTDSLASKLIGSNVYSTLATNNGAPAKAASTGTAANGVAPAATGTNGGQAATASDTDMQQIGTIHDLIMSSDGKVDAVVIGFGGLLGLGEKNVAVSYGDLHWSVAKDGSVRANLDTTADALKSAPDFKYPANGQAMKADAVPASQGSAAPGTSAATTAATGAATTMTPATPATDSTANATVTDPQTFASKAAVSNMFEIQSSQLAVSVSQNADVKKFAQQMIADHTKAGQEMQQAAQTEKVEVPTALDAADAQKLAQLKGLSGQQFDSAYIPMQVAAHNDAVALFQGFSQSGQAGALKDFAGKTLPTLKMHLQMANALGGK